MIQIHSNEKVRVGQVSDYKIIVRLLLIEYKRSKKSARFCFLKFL